MKSKFSKTPNDKNYKYVRFVSCHVLDNPWLATGVITYSRIDLKHFSKTDKKKIRACWKWLNDNIECPRYSKIKAFSDCVAWWKKGCVPKKMRELVSIYRKKFIVRTMRAKYPGKILYRDRHQVLATTPKKWSTPS